MDLNEIVLNTMKKMESEKTIEAIVQKEIESTITSIVHDTYGKYSEFSKSLEKEVEKELQIDFSKLNISTYNHMILNSVQDTLDSVIKLEGAHAAAESIKNLLQDPKREYKLSELVHMLSEQIDDLEDLEYEECHEMSLHVDESKYGSRFISMDAKEDVSEYNCKYKLLLSDTGRLYSIRINNEEVSNINGVNFQNLQIMNNMDELNETFLKIFTSGALIELDEDYCETEFFNPNFTD